jgi:hypothetical protein
MSRATCAVAPLEPTMGVRARVASRTALTMSRRPVPVVKHLATPAAISVGMSSCGRIPPM